MPIKAYYLDGKGNLRLGLDEKDVSAALVSREGLLWVDISDTNEADGEFLQRVFNFHPVSVDACVDDRIHTPKVDDYGDYLSILIHGINYTVESDLVETTELDLFLGPNYLLSNHNFPLRGVEAVAQLVEADGRPMRRGADFLAHALIGALVHNIDSTLERLADRADAVEEKIFQRAHPSTLEEISVLKHSSLRLRRAMTPQVEVIRSLSHREFELISQDAEMFYRDILDRAVRITGLIENLRERADTILATHLSAVAHQQNESMKTLATIASIFLPLTLLAGIYGMNFQNMPELSWRWSYFALLAFIGAVALGTLSWLWARRWIALGRRRMGTFMPGAVNQEKLRGSVGHNARRTH